MIRDEDTTWGVGEMGGIAASLRRAMCRSRSRGRRRALSRLIQSLARDMPLSP